MREHEDTQTVRRIWEVLGISNYADAKGMSIVEHVADLKRRAELWERLHDAARAQYQEAIWDRLKEPACSYRHCPGAT